MNTIGLQVDNKRKKQLLLPASDRPVKTAAVWAPTAIRLAGEDLIFSDERIQTRASAPPSLLVDFVELSDDPEAILRFAKKWGALSLRDKHRPTTAIDGELCSAEPLEVWREKSRIFGALLRIGAELNVERNGRDADWQILGLRDTSRVSASIHEARLSLMGQVRRLVDESRLVPRLYWDKATAQWRIDLDAQHVSNLLAVLVVKLMIEIADKQGYAICSNCHQGYAVSRRPAAGRRNYCEKLECRRARYRDSKRDIRARAKGE